MATSSPPTLPDQALPVLARIETLWRKPWLISALAQQGPHHYEQGTPIEDAHVVGGCANHTWLVLADGVGSSPMSHHGSRIATTRVAQYLSDKLSAEGKPGTALITEAFGAAHEALAATAEADQRDIADYACTLAAVLLSGNTIVAGNIGDSGIAAYSTHLKGDRPTSRLDAFASSTQPPTRATYAITHTDWRKLMTCRDSTSPHIKAVVLATDGANNFYLNEELIPPAFDTTYLDAFNNAVAKLTPRNFCNFFATYLINEEPDNSDDRTLLVAYRLDATLQPPDARR